MIAAKKYKALNKLASQGGIVILGDGEDCKIPLCELKQAFSLDNNIYNRSVDGLSVSDAKQFYSDCIAELRPDTVFIHIGRADIKMFAENRTEFDIRYHELISEIRKDSKRLAIVIVSLKNYYDDDVISEMNRHLKYISESEHCEFADISKKHTWNPHQTKDVVSFIYSIGFVRPLYNKRPFYDLVKILFCYEPEFET